MPTTLEQLRTARDSARQRRDSTAKRLKRIVLKLVTRLEAYEHELTLLSKVERGLVVNGKADWELLAIPTTEAKRTETRFDAPPPTFAVLTPENAPDAPDAVRRASPMPAVGTATEKMEPVLAAASPGGPPPPARSASLSDAGGANLPAAGEVF